MIYSASIPVLKAIVDMYLTDMPELRDKLTRHDIIELEAAVTIHADNAQQAVQQVGEILAQWYEERVLRPQRVALRMRALRQTALRSSSRSHVLRRAAPSWQRRPGTELKRFRWRLTRPLPGYTPPD